MKLKKTVILFFLWRMCLFFPLLINNLIPFRNGYDYTILWNYVKPYWPVNIPLLFPWANFDGIHYMAIASQGYSDNIRFFPFYPILIKLFSFDWLFSSLPYGLTYFISGFFISNISYFLALIFLYKLFSLDKYPKNTIFLSLIFMTIFPTSFFFGSIYSESLFLLLIILSFYSARKNQWVLSGLFGILASATRLVGLALIPALLVEYYIQHKHKKDKKFVLHLFSIFSISIGVLSFAVFNFITKNSFFAFLTAQGKLANGRSTTALILIPQTLYRYIKIFITVPFGNYDLWVAMLEFVLFFFTLFGFYLMWKKKVRISYVVFSLFLFLIPTSSGTFSGLPRYILPLFPLFITYAQSFNRMGKYMYIYINIVLGVILMMLFSRGYYIA